MTWIHGAKKRVEFTTTSPRHSRVRSCTINHGTILKLVEMAVRASVLACLFTLATFLTVWCMNNAQPWYVPHWHKSILDHLHIQKPLFSLSLEHTGPSSAMPSSPTDWTTERIRECGGEGCRGPELHTHFFPVEGWNVWISSAHPHTHAR